MYYALEKKIYHFLGSLNNNLFKRKGKNIPYNSAVYGRH